MRDQWRCRICGIRVRKTMELVPDRAEHHHLTPRSLAPALVHDPRNVALVCALDHTKLTRHELTVIADQLFTFEGHEYPSAEGLLRFEKVIGG